MRLKSSRHYISTIAVFPSALSPTRGRLVAGTISIPCSIGRGGFGRTKREGDGKTPVGRFRLGQLWWRADRHPRPASSLGPARRITTRDGWCEDPRSSCYNRAVKLPHPAAHETMLREDALYDYVIEIGYNMGPIARGRGSAIFLHLARPGFLPTAGCVGVDMAAMRRLLRVVGPNTRIRVA